MYAKGFATPSDNSPCCNSIDFHAFPVVLSILPTEEKTHKPNWNSNYAKHPYQKTRQTIFPSGSMFMNKLQNTTPQLQCHLGGNHFGTLTTQMNNLCTRCKHNLPTSLLELITPIGFFSIDKKLFIHCTNRINCLLLYKHKTTGYDINLSLVSSVPPSHSLSSKEPVLWKYLI